LLLGAAAACGSGPIASHDVELDINVLTEVASWAIQLQGTEDPFAVRALETVAVDMLVLDPVRSQRGMSDHPTAELVRRLQRSAGGRLPQKRVIAYLNVGQAEDYRAYWQPDWRAPTADAPGSPPFLLGLDPDGWAGNYPVAYWDPAWRRCLFGHPDAPLDQILADGFEGVYLDWILGYADRHVAAAAAAQGIDPAAAMVDLLRELRAYARARYPLFAMIAQNGVHLAERVPGLLDVVDALVQEDVSFRGSASASWFDAGAGDAPAPPEGDWSTARLLERLRAATHGAVPVFTLDYALVPANIEAATRASRAAGFVPFVSRTPLDRLPPHVLPKH
jgi:cysteinyl-tRNA synthetase